MQWLANLLGVDGVALQTRWLAFEPLLESGRIEGGRDGMPPEVRWVVDVAAELGVNVPESDRAEIEEGWDLTQRTALLNPPAASLEAVTELRARGFRLGLLSNTHALELRAWPRSPLAPLFDAVVLSHEAGVYKPEPAAFVAVLERLGCPAELAAYVGDGSSDELAGARTAGFGCVILADEAARLHAPEDLPRLRAQADHSVATLTELARLLEPLGES
jgi:putative hydrolase of the HAD superfamily